ncbi:hypothetical protein LOC67_05470 [Stieleria sp. JC731]|uniref:hypothetical protein n=1 Tax=Pirellulaceae TaxID=2691357 RepID=UPI001E5593C7|nr:hypothetical protein [Stieleria sp. JC731]MCC9600003.1 hypothetical protein [Stieleria sp. JC731]
MRQARQPGLYEVFFTASPDAVSEDVDSKSLIALPNSNTLPGPVASPTNDESQKTARESNSITNLWTDARPWVASMDLALQRDWIKTLVPIEGQLSRPNASDNASFDWEGVSTQQIAKSSELLTQLRPSQPERKAMAERVIEQLNQLSNIAGQSDITADQLPPMAAWATATLDALDQEALSRVQDGTFWTNDDSDAFYLQLARSERLSIRDASSIGTLPLLQQPDVYQGQTLQIIGLLQLAEKVEAKSNRSGIREYWKLWIVPNDGGVRPLIMMVPSLPTSYQNILLADGTPNRKGNRDVSNQLKCVGRFVKRLPYRSSVGADIAPVLIGRVLTPARASAQSLDLNNPAPQPAQQITTAGWIGILVTVIAGIMIAAGLMLRAAKESKRTRKLRQNAMEQAGFDPRVLQSDPSKTAE